jgi:hypothetical protein
MEFKVHTPDEIEWFFHGNSSYEIGDANAVLTVHDEDGRREITYGPSAWLRVEEEARVDYDPPKSVH